VPGAPKKNPALGWVVNLLGAVTHRELALKSEFAKSRASKDDLLSDMTATSGLTVDGQNRPAPVSIIAAKNCQIVHVSKSVLRPLTVSD
jgi:hypothetical protein